MDFIPAENIFPVIGVGASAGGLEAFKELVSAIPTESGMAYIFVQHLAPTHDSILAEILQKSTKVRVVEIVDQVKVEPNFIYVIPANKLLLAKGDHLVLIPRNEADRSNSIDLFFTSLAELHQDQAIGVVLSGTGSDGTVGLKTIKDMRGITIVQDKSAAYNGMPQSALEADVVDFILKPSDIPAKIGELVKDSYQQVTEDASDSNEEAFFQQILLIIKSKKGTDFKYYKQSTIRRRILRRKAISKVSSLREYQQILLENKAEQDALFKDILIPVTAFFRDTKLFDLLCQSILPSVLNAKPEHSPLRVWVAGCSTGEEAYSLAICISEYFTEHRTPRVVQIFASDISDQVIAKSRSGIYEKRDVAGVSEERLRTYFTKINGAYHISKSVREMCVFAVQNFLTDPPFARMDIISCRNVLIYMDGYLQKKALTTFHYSLNDGGWLILGKSESTSQVPDLFQQSLAPEKIYTRKSVPSKFMQVASPHSESALQRKDQQQKNLLSKKDDYQQAADEALLSLYSPVSVIINEYMDIVQFRGVTSSFLELPQGKPSLNILKMAKEGLAFELRNAIHKASLAKEVIRKEGIILEKGNRKVTIEVIPLTRTIDVYYAVVFKEELKPISGDSPAIAIPNVGQALHIDVDRIEQLEKELAQTREDMRAITEEQEAVNEELQSANEELLSGSEELQSLNEELETSKEEVQSSNEELTMLNQELIERNEQLVNARQYAEAIITTIHEPLIILNKEFTVRSANMCYYDDFKTTPRQTEGKFFFELGSGQWNTNSLKSILENVVSARTILNDLEISIVLHGAAKIFALNVRHLVDTNAEEPLILIAFQDITERRLLEQKLANESLSVFMQRQFLLGLFQDAPALLALFKGPDLICEMANVYFISAAGISDPVGKKIEDLVQDPGGNTFFKQVHQVYKTGKTFTENDRLLTPSRGAGSKEIYVNLVIQATKNSEGVIDGILFFAVDVTEQVEARRTTEANLQKVLDSLHQISWTALPDGRITFFNKQFYQYTGLTEEAALTQGWPAFANDFIQGEQDFQQETMLTDRNGVPRWFMAKSTSVRDDKGAIVLWIISCTDIHDQKLFSTELARQVDERTKELVQSNTELERSNSDLQQFASVASHDLQEPLRKIITFVALLNSKYSGTFPSEAIEYLSKISNSSDRMSQLIHELLEYSRIMHANKKFAIVDMDVIIRNVLNDLDLVISETAAVIRYDQAFPSIEANSLQMNHLFYNLLSNALKFFAKGKVPDVSINFRYPSAEEITSYHLPDDGQFVDFMVTDKGIGFEQNYERQIFQIFERLHPIDEFAGTGIGLALCKKIAENHSGHIFARSKANEGTTFHVVLPVKQVT